MSRPKFIRITGWKRNPDKTGPKWLRWQGWKRNPVPIIPRESWGARVVPRAIMGGAWRGKVTLVVHHTVTARAKSSTTDAGRAAVRKVDAVHDGKAGRPNGVGYHYLASGGALFEGRGFETVAAAAFDSARGIGWNRGRYVHVAIPGDYTRSGIRSSDLRAIDDLIWHLRKRGAKVTSIIGHGDLMPTACPGAQGRKDLAAYFGKRWKGKR